MNYIVSRIVKLYIDLYLKSVSSSGANQYYFLGRGNNLGRKAEGWGCEEGKYDIHM